MQTERFVIQKDRVIEKEKSLPVFEKHDVIVAGGGVAGVAAAIAAARNGVHTLLVERGGCLGGIATAGLMYMAYAPFSTLSGIGRELYEKMIESGSGIDDILMPFDAEQFKYHALQTAREAGVDFLFHTMLADTMMSGNTVKGVVVENKSGRGVLLADIVVDATGDGDVAYMAGAPYVKGREEDGRMRPITLLFRMGGIDVDGVLRYIKDNPGDFAQDPAKNVMLQEKGFFRIVGFFSLIEAAKQRGEIDPDLHYVRLECLSPQTSMAMINTTRVYDVDGTDAGDLTRSELIARRQMMQLVKLFKKSFPGFTHSFLIDSASMIGVRETRHITGDYVLSEENIAEKKIFSSIIARNAVRLTPGKDVHSPDGMEGSKTDDRHRTHIDELNWHGVPYETLLPKGIENLLTAGKCISATHDADKWIRVQSCCMATGQAAGTAAALSVNNNTPPRNLPVSMLQDRLMSQGVILEF